MRLSSVGLPVLLLALASCGGGAPATLSETGTAASNADVATIVGHVSDPGTKGSVLAFAYAGGAGELADREPLSVATVEDGGFTMVIPPAEGVILAFLADGSNDGVIDGGDPVVVLSDPKLAQLQAGDTAQLTDVVLNFPAHTAVAGSIEVHSAGAPQEAHFTPTPVPAG